MKNELINDPTCRHTGTSEWEKYWYDVGLNMIERDGPIQLDIELNTNCNQRCKKCIQPLKPLSLDFNVFTKLIDNGKEYNLRSIKPQYRGEPLIYPKIIEVMEYAKKAGIFIHFNTNGQLLTTKIIEALVKFEIDEILITIDSSIPKIYKQLHRKGDLLHLHGKIIELQTLKKLKKAEKPIVRIQAVIQLLNHAEIKSGAYKKYWEDIVDEIGTMELFSLLDNTENAKRLPNWHCEQLWQRLIVLANGDVLPCCCGIDYKENIVYKVGNIFENTIQEIWNSSRVRKLRKQHSLGNSHYFEMCRKCRLRKFILERL